MVCLSDFNCSLHGSCFDGKCLCQVQYTGDSCTRSNVLYNFTFGAVFSVLGAVGFIQLIYCIYNEYKQIKNHGAFLLAFRLTTQKLLYGLVITASSTIIMYFTMQEQLSERWLTLIDIAYHPLLITGLSLVACYWSEAFFLETASIDASRNARFLSKSSLAFSTFNAFLYVILSVQFITAGTNNMSGTLFDGVIQACFAALLFVVYVIFLAIGVEIYFKIRGAFTVSNGDNGLLCTPAEAVNRCEVTKSRVALIFQALLTLLTVLCVFFDAVGNLMNYHVDTFTRNTHQIIYRVAEFGVVVWFPCVLWSSSNPQKLWFLNPRCLLRTLAVGESTPLNLHDDVTDHQQQLSYGTFNQQLEEKINGEDLIQGECWICYDSTRRDSGPFIRPCLCKGGTAQVHHNCLRKWLHLNSHHQDQCCRICKHPYKVEQRDVGVVDLIRGWRKTVIIAVTVLAAVCAPCTCFVVYMHDEMETYVRVLVVGSTVLIEYAAFKILGVKFARLYELTRENALRIFNYDSAGTSNSSQNNAVEEPLLRSYHVPIEVHSDPLLTI